jgi:hypothetical protein
MVKLIQSDTEVINAKRKIKQSDAVVYAKQNGRSKTNGQGAKQAEGRKSNWRGAK